MVLIDSPIWGGFLTGAPSDVRVVRELIEERSRAVLCGVVLRDVLAGVVDDEQRERVRQRLVALPFLDTTVEHYVHAGALLAGRRVHGSAELGAADAMLAAHALLDDVRLLTRSGLLRRLADEVSFRLYREES